jgi:hypothetical protein
VFSTEYRNKACTDGRRSKVYSKLDLKALWHVYFYVNTNVSLNHRSLIPLKQGKPLRRIQNTKINMTTGIKMQAIGICGLTQCDSVEISRLKYYVCLFSFN